MLEKQLKRYRRHRRIRAKIKGTAKIPRLSVFKSLNHIYAQFVDDEKGNIILSLSDIKLRKLNSFDKFGVDGEQSRTIKTQNSKPKDKKAEDEKKQVSRKVAIAYRVGKLLAEKALKNKIKKVVFDRGGYKYHGRIKSLANGAREGGLEF